MKKFVVIAILLLISSLCHAQALKPNFDPTIGFRTFSAAKAYSVCVASKGPGACNPMLHQLVNSNEAVTLTKDYATLLLVGSFPEYGLLECRVMGTNFILWFRAEELRMK